MVKLYLPYIVKPLDSPWEVYSHAQSPWSFRRITTFKCHNFCYYQYVYWLLYFLVWKGYLLCWHELKKCQLLFRYSSQERGTSIVIRGTYYVYSECFVLCIFVFLLIVYGSGLSKYSIHPGLLWFSYSALWYLWNLLSICEISFIIWAVL